MVHPIQPRNLDDIHSAPPNGGNDIELQDVRGREEEREQIVLAPVDKGIQAWLLLAGCFVINVLIWGV